MGRPDDEGEPRQVGLAGPMKVNTSFFRSLHALWALVVAGGFVAWMVGGGHAPGRGAGSDRGYLLWSGWIALALFAVVVAYSLRKFVHRLGVSPEFRMKVGAESVELAEKEIHALRRRISSGALTEKGEVASQARKILKEAGVDKILRAEVREVVVGDESTVEIALRPTEPLGRVAKWMHAHIYLGLASAVLVWIHGGGDLASPMAILLNGLSFLVIATGIFGIVVWALGPTWMTRAERDLTIEEAFVIERGLGRKVDAARTDEPYRTALETLGPPEWKDAWLAGAASGRFGDDVRAGLRATRDEALAAGRRAKEEQDKDAQKEARGRLAACAALQDHSALVAQHGRVSSTLRALMRIKLLMNVWRIVHVPASVALIGLLGFHVFSVWWY
ncbi:MAG: hypothetical protein O7B99_05715 [Planctomycetota bacterium]|nr:hypothetical protein [Planctomycetota bacterium]